jgi:hypothetical protein
VDGGGSGFNTQAPHTIRAASTGAMMNTQTMFVTMDLAVMLWSSAMGGEDSEQRLLVDTRSGKNIAVDISERHSSPE